MNSVNFDSFIKKMNRVYISPSQTRQMQEICSPLRKRHGIHHYFYLNIKRDGTGYFLSSFAESTRHWIENQYEMIPSILDPGSQLKFWFLFPPNEKFAPLLHELKVQFNIGNVINHYHLDKNSIQLFGFGSPMDFATASNRYLNHRDELENFCLDFKDRAKSILFENDNQRTPIPNLFCPGLARLIPTNIGPTMPFTNREWDCIRLLEHGMTAREIGLELSLSFRTIEHHLENIKSKLGIQKKSQIIRALKIASE